jgi:hypothetical protein
LTTSGAVPAVTAATILSNLSAPRRGVMSTVIPGACCSNAAFTCFMPSTWNPDQLNQN